MFRLFGVLASMLLSTSLCNGAVVFDLTGLGGTFDGNSTASLTIGGITATFDAGADELNSNASTFGINNGSNTAPNNNDAIGGSELLAVAFDQNVTIDQLVVTNLSGGEEVLATFGTNAQLSLGDSGSGTDVFNFLTSNEVNTGQFLLLEASGGDYNIISFTASVTAVPEPSSVVMLTCVSVVGGVCARQRKRSAKVALA